MEQTPAIFGDVYENVGELGRGTTGTVYEARHKRLNRRFALKVPDLSSEAERPAKAQRFLWECQTLAYLRGGPDCNIPRLHMVTEHPAGCLYSARELVMGSTLEQRAAEGSIDIRAGFSVIAEVARVVQWVREQGFVHRNLSPANVLVAQDGIAWLIGFGRVGLLAGSHHAPAGGGTLPDVDVQNLQHMLQWLCRALGKPAPAALMRVVDSGSVISAGVLAEALLSYAEGE